MTGALIGVISAIIGAFAGQILHALYDRRKENRRMHHDSLRNHFKDLETRIIMPISDIIRGIAIDRVGLSVKGATYGSRAYNSYTKNFEQGDSYIFKLHFPDQEEKVTKLMDEVGKHNELSKSFTNKLKELIEEKTGLPVREGEGRPFVYTSMPIYLQQTLLQLTEGESPTYDFRQARIEKRNDFWEVCKVGTIYAEVTTEEEGNSCKCGLIELAESTSLLKDISQILDRAKQLENESGVIANLLDFTCRQYGELGQLLEQEKECPYCQVIFHTKKRVENV